MLAPVLVDGRIGGYWRLRARAGPARSTSRLPRLPPAPQGRGGRRGRRPLDRARRADRLRHPHPALARLGSLGRTPRQALGPGGGHAFRFRGGPASLAGGAGQPDVGREVLLAGHRDRPLGDVGQGRRRAGARRPQRAGSRPGTGSPTGPGAPHDVAARTRRPPHGRAPTGSRRTPPSRRVRPRRLRGPGRTRTGRRRAARGRRRGPAAVGVRREPAGAEPAVGSGSAVPELGEVVLVELPELLDDRPVVGPGDVDAAAARRRRRPGRRSPRAAAGASASSAAVTQSGW